MISLENLAGNGAGIHSEISGRIPQEVLLRFLR